MATQRPSIQAAVSQRNQPPPVDLPAPRPRKAAASDPAASREGRVNISAYFPKEVKASLRLVQAKRGGKVQDLLAEALNLLFSKYNVPESAPMNNKAS